MEPVRRPALRGGVYISMFGHSEPARTLAWESPIWPQATVSL